MIECIIAARFANPFRLGIKVNLYRDYAYRATSKYLAEIGTNAFETVMAGDAYFMSRRGHDSTRISIEISVQLMALANIFTPSPRNHIELDDCTEVFVEAGL